MQSQWSLFRRAIATLVIMGTAGVPQLLRAAAPAPTTQAAPQVRSTLSSPQTQRAALEAVKADAVRNLESGNPTVVRRAQRVLRSYDIATATGAERHRLIRQLPVKVERRSATDGRNGDILSFIVNGRVRSEVFQPASVIPLADGDSPYSSGAIEDCADNEPPPCATWLEHEDMLIVIADHNYQMELLEAEHAAEYAAYETFCGENPWACSGAVAVPDSASGMEPCYQKALTAIQTVAGSLLAGATADLAVASAVATGIKVSAATMAVINAALFTLGGVAAVTVAIAVYCFFNPTEATAYMDTLGMPFEPSRGFLM